jgi:CspA family cold shock protein
VPSYIGTVKAVVADRGFLFLSAPDGGRKDIFCHISEFEKSGVRDPERGEQYQFEIQMTEKGPQAVNIVAVL